MKYGKNCRRITAVLLCAMLAASLTFSGCQSQGNTEDTTSSAVSASSVAAEEKTPATVSLDESDVSAEYDAADSVKIMLSGKTAQIVGSGASCENGKITIDSAGTYLISGKLEEGQIVVAAKKDDEVRLVLDNVDITSSQTPVLYAEKCGKTIILLNQGSENVLTDGSDTSAAEQTTDEEQDAPDAAVFVQDDLTILGEGSLTVRANAHNGITSKDSLKITGGTVRVVTTDGDGLRSTYSKDDDENKGNVTIENADVQITSAGDGVQAEENVIVNSGTLRITTGGGAKENTSASAKNDFGRQQAASGSTDDDSQSSTKGLKAGNAITVTGGTMTIDAYDDAVHSNGDVMLKGGKITIQAGDDGIHADADLSISEGEIKAEQSYEGLEAQTIEISGGTVDITASDDGINCAGGNDSAVDTAQPDGQIQMPEMPQQPDGNMPQMPQQPDGNMPEMPQQPDGSMPEMPQQQNGNMRGMMPGQGGNMPGMADESAVLTISGGTIYVNAQGDGLDSNGALNITGGTIVVNGTTSGGNGIIDHDGNCTVSGGLLIGAGTSDMLELPGDSSEQNTLAVLFDQAQSAGTLVYVADNSGKVIASISPLKNYSCLILSSAALKSGESYTVYTGGTISGTAVNGFDAENTASGGKTYCTFTLSQDKVTYVNASGVTTYSGMGGNMGGMRGGRMGARG